MLYTYVIECESGEMYCGITNNIKRRMKEHKNEKYPHWFCNDKRRNFKVVFITEGNYEKKIKKFSNRRFMECISGQLKRFTPP